MDLGLYHHLIVFGKYVCLMSSRSLRSPAKMGQLSVSLSVVCSVVPLSGESYEMNGRKCLKREYMAFLGALPFFEHVLSETQFLLTTVNKD